jgi:hypothetical protein
MIRHVVLFTFADSVTDTQISEMSAALDALPGQIPEIASYRHGRDLGKAPGNFAYAITADFANDDDLATYRDHPDHQSFIALHIKDKVGQRAAVQYELN